MTCESSGSASPVSTLDRWELHGGVWRAVSVTGAGATVELCTCHGDPVDVVRSSDPRLLEYLRWRPRSDVAPDPS